MTRGYKNCNPGNIEQNRDVFQGEIRPSQDKRFKQFRTMAYGYRAMFVTLATYNQRGMNTIEKSYGRGRQQSKTIPNII